MALQQSAVHHRVDTGGRGRCSAIGEVCLFNSSITRQKVLQQVGGCSAEDLAVLYSLVTVD